jgi:hypothetical protein
MRLNSIDGIPGRGLHFTLSEAFAITEPVFTEAGINRPIRLKPAFDSIALGMMEREAKLPNHEVRQTGPEPEM